MFNGLVEIPSLVTKLLVHCSKALGQSKKKALNETF